MTDRQLAAMDTLNSDDDVYATTYEPDNELVMTRLRRLYPHVDLDVVQVPTHWNREDKCPMMKVSHHNLRFSYPEKEGQLIPDRKNKMDPGSIRANMPVPIFAGIYYFEVNIISSDGYMGVGLSQKSVDMKRLPGWDPYSYGYHGDDGHFFSASGTGSPYGHTFGTGDVIGCGVNMVKRTIFFTKNGEHQGTAMMIMDAIDALYPTVGLQTPHSVIDGNFGQKPFMFDIHKEIATLRENIETQMGKISLPPQKKTWLNSCVSSWLAAEGHAETLKTFYKETGTQCAGNMESIESRKALCKLVYGHRSSELGPALEEKYKGLLASNRVLAFDIRVQRFAEKMIHFIKPPHRHHSRKNGVSKEGNGCSMSASHGKEGEDTPMDGSFRTPSSARSSSTNGAATVISPIGGGSGHTTAPMSASYPPSGPLVSSSGRSEGGGGGVDDPISTISSSHSIGVSPSRPHKRRSSGVKVVEEDDDENCSSRPVCLDTGGPPPRRRTTRIDERGVQGSSKDHDDNDDAMEIDAPILDESSSSSLLIEGRSSSTEASPLTPAMDSTLDTSTTTNPPHFISSSSAPLDGPSSSKNGSISSSTHRGDSMTDVVGPSTSSGRGMRRGSQRGRDRMKGRGDEMIMMSGGGSMIKNGKSHSTSSVRHSRSIRLHSEGRNGTVGIPMTSSSKGDQKEMTTLTMKGPSIVREEPAAAMNLCDYEDGRRNRCGFTRTQEHRSNTLYNSLIKEGQVLNKELKAIYKENPSIAREAMEVLELAGCDRVRDWKNHESMSEIRLRRLAHHLNVSIVRFEGGQRIESKLAKLERMARQEKINLMKMGNPTAPFIDLEGMIFKRDRYTIKDKKKTEKSIGYLSDKEDYIAQNIVKKSNKKRRRMFQKVGDEMRKEDGMDGLSENGNGDNENKKKMMKKMKREEKKMREEIRKILEESGVQPDQMQIRMEEMLEQMKRDLEEKRRSKNRSDDDHDGESAVDEHAIPEDGADVFHDAAERMDEGDDHSARV